MEPKTRLAGQIFGKDYKLNRAGQEVLDYVSKKTGGQSIVKPLDSATFSDPRLRHAGGVVFHNDPKTAYVNPDFDRQDYILAHELAHSQAPTPVMDRYKANVRNLGSPFDADKRPVEQGYDRFAGSTFRHIFESTQAPTVIEEANAQGVAVGAMRGLNRSEKDPFYRDPREYPSGIGFRELENLDAGMGTFMDVKKDPYTGADLGKKDVFGNTEYPQMSLPASFHSEDVFNTMERMRKNIPIRVNRQYQLGIGSMQ